MKLLFSIFIAVLCMTVIQAQYRFISCGMNQTLKVENLNLNDCKELPCYFIRGETASVTMQFTPTKRVDGLKLSTAVRVGPIWVPFSLNDNEHCKMTIKNGDCPLVPNTTYTYTYSVSILEQFPAISSIFRYQLNDLDGKLLACLEFPIKIV
jgi:hypothetical protein